MIKYDDIKVSDSDCLRYSFFDDIKSGKNYTTI